MKGRNQEQRQTQIYGAEGDEIREGYGWTGDTGCLHLAVSSLLNKFQAISAGRLPRQEERQVNMRNDHQQHLIITSTMSTFAI